jgi:hypothetical protein
VTEQLPARFVAAYGEIGRSTASASEKGTFRLFPYTLELEAKTKRRTPSHRASSSIAVVPSTFTCE